ncbi:MAG: DUF1343 domain-containing protein [Lachnospiraceae bacterium]|nr:DUF1343 domain-containing protein [Lachnospiraceae bacterium]
MKTCLKQIIPVFLIVFLLVGCGKSESTQLTQDPANDQAAVASDAAQEAADTDVEEQTVPADQRDQEDTADAGLSPVNDGMQEIVTDEAGGSKTGDGDVSAANTESDEDAEGIKSREPLVYGDERFDDYLPILEGKRVAIYSNQTGVVGGGASAGNSETTGDDSQDHADSSDAADDSLTPLPTVSEGEHILDALLEKGVDVTAVFTPEHGFRGEADAGQSVGSGVDEKTGVPILSLYGSGSVGPSGSDLDKFDVLVIDIEDVGVRYYTYHITMFHLMNACAKAGKKIVLLDRPNPNGFYVDGPILENAFASGVGRLPLPVVYGMTLGELAQMINGEGWLSAGQGAADLTVISCLNYTHRDKVALSVRPSPNLKDMRAVYLYPSTCYFENTAVSVGRGTENPFEIYGSPYLKGAASTDGDQSLGNDYEFTPKSMSGAKNPQFEGQTCYGKDLREIPLERIWQEQIDLRYVMDAYKAVKESHPDVSFFGKKDGNGTYWIDKLFGTDRVRKMIEEGKTAEEIKNSWQSEIEAFKVQRKPYLLYEE